MPPPPAPVAKAHSMFAKKTSSRTISLKALSSGAGPLKKSQAASIVSNKATIIARLQGDPALPPSLHSPLRKTAMPTVQTDEESTASHSVAQGASCARKKGMMKKIPLQALVTMVHGMTLRRREKKAVNPCSLRATRPHLWSKIPSMHMSKVVLLWTRDPLALPAKIPLMLMGKKKDSPAAPCTTNPVQDSSSKDPFNRVDRLGSSLAMHRIFKPIPSPSAPRSLDGHLASLERHDAASVESKDSTASRAKTDDMTPHNVLPSAFAPPSPLSVSPSASSQCGNGKSSPVASMSFTPLPSNPIKRAMLFLPHGALPNGFPEANRPHGRS